MSKKIDSLSRSHPGFLNTYYRNQSEEVKVNIRLALGAFVTFKLNSGKTKENKLNS